MAGAFSTGAAGAVFATVVNGAPCVHVKLLPTIVPVTAWPELSPTDVPEPSFNPQRPCRFVAEMISPVIPSAICCAVRATFQMRTSSMAPSKNPAAAPVDVRALPIAACWMLSDRGGRPTVSDPSCTPFRYRRNVVPSYVAAAWYQTLFRIGVVPDTGWFNPGLGAPAPSSKSAVRTLPVLLIPRK